MILLSANAKKEWSKGANSALSDGRIVMGIKRNNHKEIENCQNQKNGDKSCRLRYVTKWYSFSNFGLPRPASMLSSA